MKNVKPTKKRKASVKYKKRYWPKALKPKRIKRPLVFHYPEITDIPYLKAEYNDDGKIIKYVYRPPQELSHILRGKPKTFKNNISEEKIRMICAKYQELLHFNKTFGTTAGEPSGDTTLGHAIKRYFRSRFSGRLRQSTRILYEGYVNALDRMHTEDGRPVLSVTLRELDRSMANRIYDTAVANIGITRAERIVSFLKRIFNISMYEWNLVNKVNPFAKLDTIKPIPKVRLWIEEEVYRFATTAKRMGMESLGLIIRLCYDLAQRPIDIRLMSKESFRETDEGAEFSFIQTKTKTEMRLDISPKLVYDIKRWQDNMPIFYHRKYQGYMFLNEKSMHPWKSSFTSKCREVMNEAGLSKDLQIRFIRNTVATELADSGATEAEIMAVTGHKSSASVQRYIKPTKAQAQRAQDLRKKMKEEKSKEKGWRV